MAVSLVSEAMAIFAKTKDALPCSRLALTAHDFSGLVSGRGSIASFLRVLPSPSPSPEPAKSVPEAILAVDSSRRRGSGRSLRKVGASRVGGEKTSFFNVGRSEVAAEPDSSISGGGSGDPGGGDGSGSVWGGDTRPSHPAGGEHDKPPSSPLRPRDTCPKCGKMLANEDLREHLDFHFAEGLQERYSREGGVAQDTASGMPDRGGVSKRRRTEMGGKRTKSHTKRQAAQRIDTFFKPT